MCGLLRCACWFVPHPNRQCHFKFGTERNGVILWLAKIFRFFSLTTSKACPWRRTCLCVCVCSKHFFQRQSDHGERGDHVREEVVGNSLIYLVSYVLSIVNHVKRRAQLAPTPHPPALSTSHTSALGTSAPFVPNIFFWETVNGSRAKGDSAWVIPCLWHLSDLLLNVWTVSHNPPHTLRGLSCHTDREHCFRSNAACT